MYSDTKSAVANALTRIFGAVFLLAGCFVIFHAIRQVLYEASAVVVFQKDIGTVTKYVVPDKAAEERVAGGQLQFDYTVDGRSYSGQLERSTKEGLAWTGRLLATPHHVGESVDVYYDPSAPEVCTLYLAVNPECFARIIFPAPFAMIGFLMLTVPYRFVRQSRGTVHRKMSRGTLFVIVYGALSATSGLGLAFAANSIDWRIGAVLGTLLPTALIPLAAQFMVSLVFGPPGSAFDMHSRRQAVRRSKRRRTAAFLAAFSVFWWGLLSIFLIGLGRSFVQYLQAQQRYVAVEGRIIKSDLRKIDNTGRGASPTWRPVVVYTYQGESTELQGDHIGLGEFRPTGPRDAAQRICNQYPLHSSVTVYYDPVEPSRSVLDISFLKYYAFTLFGLSIFVIAGFGLIGGAAWFVVPEPEDAPHRFPSCLALVGASWFVTHVLSILVLGFAGADQPDRAEFVWVGVGMVALVIVVATCAGFLRRDA